MNVQCGKDRSETQNSTEKLQNFFEAQVLLSQSV